MLSKSYHSKPFRRGSVNIIFRKIWTQLISPFILCGNVCKAAPATLGLVSLILIQVLYLYCDERRNIP